MRDILTGGTGNGPDGESDTFLYFSKLDSGITAATRDVITDFEGSGVAGGDLIELAEIDAKEGVSFPGDDAFTFIGVAAFSVGVQGQLRQQFTSQGTLLWGETNGDGKADFSILVKGQHFFTADDFFL